MIDKLIIRMAEWIATQILPSTILKIMFVALILSSLAGLMVGYWIIIFTLVVNNLMWLVTEFLYAKHEEDEDS